MRTAAVLFASALSFTTYSLYASAADVGPEWSVQGEAPQLYSGTVDHADSPSGKGSMVLKRTETSHPYGSAWLVKSLPAEYAGKQLRVSYHVRSEGEGPIGNSIVILDSHGQHASGYPATRHWSWHRKLITLPKGTTGMATGIGLKGPGTVKIDRIQIEVVGDAPEEQNARQIVSLKDDDK